jgi:chromosome partitioning protein
MSSCTHVGMKIIAVESQKGGSGKTTIAVHLAQAFASGGYQVLLLDLDPQTSAAEWKDVRADESPAVMAVPAGRLQRVIDQAKEIGTEILIIDTAPHSEGTALAAARASDFILVPCQPSIVDLRALRKTAELLGHVKKPTHVVLNGVSPNEGVSNEAARTITEEFGLPVSDIRMASRVAFSRCMITGNTAGEYEPEGKAAREAAKLYKWICRLVDMPMRKAQ